MKFDVKNLGEHQIIFTCLSETFVVFILRSDFEIF